MNDPAVVGIEGIGLNRAACGADRLGELLHFGNQRIIPHGAVMLDIDNDARGVRRLRRLNAINQILQIIHNLFVTADEAVRLAG